MMSGRDLPVHQEGGQHADHDDERQRLEGQDETGFGIGDIVGRLPAAEIAEDERCAFLRGGLQLGEGVV
ncbi:MAG: hypothetical protein U5O39_14490 [Gammaproteobacteria bacterium]|nr:hypothetical protein [Gammaproteobacteria bacterium]